MPPTCNMESTFYSLSRVKFSFLSALPQTGQPKVERPAQFTRGWRSECMHAVSVHSRYSGRIRILAIEALDQLAHAMRFDEMFTSLYTEKKCVDSFCKASCIKISHLYNFLLNAGSEWLDTQFRKCVHFKKKCLIFSCYFLNSVCEVLVWFLFARWRRNRSMSMSVAMLVHVSEHMCY